MHREEEEGDWCQVPAINMLMNSFSCLFLFIRGGCRESWVFRTQVSSLQAAGPVIITLNLTIFPGPRPWSHLCLTTSTSVSSSTYQRPLCQNQSHTTTLFLWARLFIISEAVLGVHISVLVSALHPPHPVRERVSSSVFRPGCSQHSVVAPSSNFNHNFVHLGALKTSQSVVFPHQSL